ncbi:hypothetical protein IAU60_004204 [Kwoniella sp. DSM 27419]
MASHEPDQQNRSTSPSQPSVLDTSTGVVPLTAVSASAPGAKPIYAFFGGSSSAGAGPSTPGGSAGGPPKKRRKKVDGKAQAQATLALGAAGSPGADAPKAGWVIAQPTAEHETAGSGTRRRGAGGEEDEMRDMAKSGSGKAKAKRKSAAAAGDAIQRAYALGPNPDYDPDDLLDPALNHVDGLTTLRASQASSSPAKKRGRPRKPAAASTIDNSSSLDRPSASSLCPSGLAGPSHTRHRHSNDFEITSISIGSSQTSLSRTSSLKGLHALDAIDIEEEGGGPAVPKPNSQASTTAVEPKAPVLPKKIAFDADRTKPAHGFFARIAPGQASGRFRASSAASETVGDIPPVVQQVPITQTVETKGKEKDKRSKPHSFFVMSAQATLGRLKDGWGQGVKEGDEWPAPWPSGTLTDQAEAESSPYTDSGVGPSRRAKHLAPHATDDGFWYSVLESSSQIPRSTASHPPQAFAIPTYMEQHPAFASLRNKRAGKATNREAWTERYRPHRASEVLSNEVEATYLRDWLSTLSLGQHEIDSRKVVRKVRRGKLKSALIDGWIVDDLNVFQGAAAVPPAEEEDEPELDDLDEPGVSDDLGQRPNSYPSLHSRLTNTILLSGPSGSGKSAAVYAVAQELGWDVFEVFAGMGRRTGSNLAGWVGDVGRNHMVANGPAQVFERNGNGKGHSDGKLADGRKKEESKASGLKSFFGKAKAMTKTLSKDRLESASQGSATEPIDIDEDEMPTGAHEIPADAPAAVSIHAGELGAAETKAGPGVEAASTTPGKVRQSLILLDEVDILFDEESTFWPAVVSLIAESRRPVILTCNDHTRLPKDQLPLQAILQFRPPPSHIAIPYLSSIAIQEGCADGEAIPRLWRESMHRGGEVALDQPLPPNGNEPVPCADLRRAITQLQLDRGVNLEHAAEGHREDRLMVLAGDVEENDDLDVLARRFEATSYADAFVDLRPAAKLELYEIDRHAPTADDELGPRLLVKPEMDDAYPVYAGSDISPIISGRLVGLAGGQLPILGDVQLARTQYIRSTLTLLDPLIPLSAPLLPRPSIFLHTLPAILQIIEADDLLQLAEDDAVLRGEERINRRTGRPVRGFGEYARWFEMDEEAHLAGRRLAGLRLKV